MRNKKINFNIVGKFGTILADPPWEFKNKTGKIAPQYKKTNRYNTLSLEDIKSLPIERVSSKRSHLYLWVPNAFIKEGLEVMESWGFKYKTNIVWTKIRKDEGPDGRGVGFYFRNTTELVLFGVRGNNVRTRKPGRTQVNIIRTRKREHSRKPDELYEIIEKCSWGPFLELFARGKRKKWTNWGNQSKKYTISWNTYKNNSKAKIKA